MAPMYFWKSRKNAKQVDEIEISPLQETPKKPLPVKKARKVSKVPKMPPNEAVSIVTNPIRWRILELLEEPMTPKQLSKLLDPGKVTPAKVLYHLKLLEEARAVKSSLYGDYKRRLLFSRVPVDATVTVDESTVEASFDNE